MTGLDLRITEDAKILCRLEGPGNGRVLAFELELDEEEGAVSYSLVEMKGMDQTGLPSFFREAINFPLAQTPVPQDVQASPRSMACCKSPAKTCRCVVV